MSKVTILMIMVFVLCNCKGQKPSVFSIDERQEIIVNKTFGKGEKEFLPNAEGTRVLIIENLSESSPKTPRSDKKIWSIGH